jgi:hypothetical protein
MSDRQTREAPEARTPEHRPSPSWRLPPFVAAVGAVALIVNDIADLSGKFTNLITPIGFAIILVVVAAWIVRTPLTERTLKAVLVCTIFVAAAALTLISLGVLPRPYAPKVETQPGLSPPANDLKVVGPSGQITKCPRVELAGTAPSGWVPWVAVGPGDNYKGGEYWYFSYREVKPQGSGRYATENFQVGNDIDKGGSYNIFVFLVPDGQSKLLNTVREQMENVRGETKGAEINLPFPVPYSSQIDKKPVMRVSDDC